MTTDGFVFTLRIFQHIAFEVGNAEETVGVFTAD